MRPWLRWSEWATCRRRPRSGPYCNSAGLSFTTVWGFGAVPPRTWPAADLTANDWSHAPDLAITRLVLGDVAGYRAVRAAMLRRIESPASVAV